MNLIFIAQLVPKPTWYWFILQIEGNYPTLSGIVGTELPVSEVKQPEPPTPPTGPPNFANSFYLEWLILAAAIDRLALVLYCIIFSTMFLCFV